MPVMEMFGKIKGIAPSFQANRQEDAAKQVLKTVGDVSLEKGATEARSLDSKASSFGREQGIL